MLKRTGRPSDRNAAINSFESINPSPLSKISATFVISSRVVGNSEKVILYKHIKSAIAIEVNGIEVVTLS